MSSEQLKPIDPAIPTPSSFLGFNVGEDHRLVDWPDIVEYMELLDACSNKIHSIEVGQTTEGNPFLLTFISSPTNIANLKQHKETQHLLSDPRKLPRHRVAELISSARVVVAITCSIHATEVGGTQMSLELAYKMAASSSKSVQRILDNVILILIPSLNPDGLIKVKRWYDRTKDTYYEGSIPPYLYHKYTGHDNNRDWFMFTQLETRLVVDHVYNQWHPHITYDIHQTRSDGMRMILPPFIDPVGPNVDPVLQSELAALGSHMASELTASGKQGVAVNVVYDSYSPSRSYVHYHGGIRVLSEVASAKIASPIYIETTQLTSARGERPLIKSWNHTMPWHGGRWSLKDIVDYDLIASFACLDNAARNRDTWVNNSFHVLKRAVRDQINPSGFIIPKEQHDASARKELIEVLRFAQVEVNEITERIDLNDILLHPGDQYISLAQPFGSFAQTMLETQKYPDIRLYPGAPPKQPYDSTAHCLPLMMGVTAYQLNKPITSGFRNSECAPNRVHSDKPALSSNEGYVISPRSNEVVKVVNKLLASGVRVSRTKTSSSVEQNVLAGGTYFVEASEMASGILQKARETGLIELSTIDDEFQSGRTKLKPPKLGVYQSYVPSTEEGWTRFILDEYGFKHEPIWDWVIKENDLLGQFDAIIVPHQTVHQIHRGFNQASYSKRYSGGLGEIGAANLRDFAEQGGTLIVWDGSARWAARHLELPVVNVLAGLTNSEFFAPGTLLNITVDTTHPIGWGMTKNAAALFMNGLAWNLKDGRSIAEFSNEHGLLSGLLIGADKIAGSTALASIPMGFGQIIMFGFRPHFRAQTRGTYKLFFNAIFSSVSDS